ncbi:MAG: hypothetical protein ACREM3_22585 [Candidatus Rokuibacteriota bacterium]
MRIERWRTWLLSLVVVLGLTGCAGTGASTAGTAVAVTDLSSVAGKWTGLLELAGSGTREDFVELTVDRSGAYRAVTARTIGAMDAQGRVAVSGGKILLQGERGSRATATLYTQQTQRALLVEGATPEGRRFSARLRQQP